jgi:hypothetical protein
LLDELQTTCDDTLRRVDSALRADAATVKERMPAISAALEQLDEIDAALDRSVHG